MDDVENDLVLLRSLVARELETINCYRLLARDCEDESTVQEFILHIIDEEKLHIADTLQAIAQIDESQSDLFKRGFAEGHKPGELPSDDTGYAAGAEARSSNSSSTTDNRERVWPLQSIPATQQSAEIDSTRGLAFQSGLETAPDLIQGDVVPRPGVESAVEARSGSSWTVGSLRGVPQSQ